MAVTEEDDQGRRRGGVFVLILAVALSISTAVGIAKAVDSTSTDRVNPSTTAPVYGTP